MSFKHFCWFTLAAVLVFLAAVVFLCLAPFTRNSGLRVWEESVGLCGFLLTPPLLCLLFLLAARLGLEYGFGKRARGELELLLQQKRQGLLLHGQPTIHDSTARTGRYVAAEEQIAVAGNLYATSSEGCLERLLRVKQRGVGR